MTEPIAKRWLVKGRVQGVGFRWFIQSRAEALGIRGWVANREDGAVEIVALASSEVLANFELLVRRGPPGARVTDVTQEEVPHDAVDAKSFSIKH